MTSVSPDYLQQKQMEKLTSQPKLDGRPGVTENVRGEKSLGMISLLCFQVLLGILPSSQILQMKQQELFQLVLQTTTKAGPEDMAFSNATATKKCDWF